MCLVESQKILTGKSYPEWGADQQQLTGQLVRMKTLWPLSDLSGQTPPVKMIHGHITISEALVWSG